MDPTRRISDAELATTNVPAAVAAALTSGVPVPGRVALAAALDADRLGTRPRSLTFLAEVVRRGGVTYAAGLAEPLPTPEQSELVRTWLAAGSTAPADELLARWLEVVATILAVRHQRQPRP